MGDVVFGAIFTILGIIAVGLVFFLLFAVVDAWLDGELKNKIKRMLK